MWIQYLAKVNQRQNNSYHPYILKTFKDHQKKIWVNQKNAINSIKISFTNSLRTFFRQKNGIDWQWFISLGANSQKYIYIIHLLPFANYPLFHKCTHHACFNVGCSLNAEYFAKYVEKENSSNDTSDFGRRMKSQAIQTKNIRRRLRRCAFSWAKISYLSNGLFVGERDPMKPAHKRNFCVSFERAFVWYIS